MAAAGKKVSVSFSLTEVNNLEVGVDGKMETRTAEGMGEADLRSAGMETGERAGARLKKYAFEARQDGLLDEMM